MKIAICMVLAVIVGIVIGFVTFEFLDDSEDIEDTAHRYEIIQ